MLKCFFLILVGILYGPVVLLRLRIHISLSISFFGMDFSKKWVYYILFKISITLASCFCEIWCRIWRNTDKKVIKDFCNGVFVYDFNFFNANVFAALAFLLNVANDLIPLHNFKCFWNIFGNKFDEFFLILCYF